MLESALTHRHSVSRLSGIVLVAAMILGVGTAGRAAAEPIFALTVTDRLLRFDSAAPGMIQTASSITGLLSGESLLGIDFRPQNGLLYGLGSGDRLYTVDLVTGAVALASVLDVPLSGTSFGIDFNPVSDRLRVVSDADASNNLRINVGTGQVTVDGTLAPIVQPAPPPDPTIGAAAYGNNVPGASATTLYHIDFFRDRLVTQTPPDSGTLVRVGELAPLMPPPLGADLTNGFVGFDISGPSGIAYASLTAPGASTSDLYTINLATGSAGLVGTIGGGEVVRGVSAAPVPVPEPGSVALLATGVAGLLGFRYRPRSRRSDVAGRDE